MKNFILAFLAFCSMSGFGQKDTTQPFQPRLIKEAPERTLLEKIERSVDDYTNQVTIHSPYGNPIEFIKIINGKKVYYYLSLTTYGGTVTLYEKDVYILFEDGTKWRKTEKIDCDASDNGYRYSAWITLNSLDLSTLKSKKIKKFRLYIHDQEVDQQLSDDFVSYVSEISKMK